MKIKNTLMSLYDTKFFEKTDKQILVHHQTLQFINHNVQKLTYNELKPKHHKQLHHLSTQ